MRYQGGKHIAAPHLVTAMEQNGLTADKPVIEPFCGGCSVTTELARRGYFLWASDLNPSLILLWQKALLTDIQPMPLNAEIFRHFKDPLTPDSAEKALVRIGASFGGNWFGGMAFCAKYTASDYLERSVRVINSQAKWLRGQAQFRCLSYLDLPATSEAVYYLDKPYEGVTKHFGGEFDHKRFWEWAKERAKTNIVFVSEYQAPCGELIFERETPLSMAAGKHGKGRTQRERLFRL